MHRTRTVAMILAGVAASAVSGCVAVAPHTTPAPVPVPAVDTPQLAQNVEPQIVQAPAREALDAALPQAPGGAAPTAERRGTTEVRRPPAPPAAPRHPAPARPAAEAPEAPAPRPAPPKATTLPRPRALPSLPLPVAGAGQGPGAGVCALGEGYGGWAPDSPQTRICRDTYGR
ncbi:hypothetical protein [Streptomyces hypolithicus]